MTVVIRKFKSDRAASAFCWRNRREAKKNNIIMNHIVKLNGEHWIEISGEFGDLSGFK